MLLPPHSSCQQLSLLLFICEFILLQERLLCRLHSSIMKVTVHHNLFITIATRNQCKWFEKFCYQKKAFKINLSFNHALCAVLLHASLADKEVSVHHHLTLNILLCNIETHCHQPPSPSLLEMLFTEISMLLEDKTH